MDTSPTATDTVRLWGTNIEETPWTLKEKKSL